MEQNQRAIHKLIILAILGQTSGLTRNQLMTLALETLYFDYFAFISAQDELVRDRLVIEAVRKDEPLTDASGHPLIRCDITPNGRNILATLEGRIPLPIRSYLASALSGWRKDQLRENTINATAAPDANGFYVVRLQQHDGRKETIDLRLNVPNQAIAEEICANWRNYPQTLYLGILSLLTEPNSQKDNAHQDIQGLAPVADDDLVPAADEDLVPVTDETASPGQEPPIASFDRQMNLPIK
jgi:hypothetical protein